MDSDLERSPAERPRTTGQVTPRPLASHGRRLHSEPGCECNSDLSPIDGLVAYAGRLGPRRFRPAGSISFPSSWASAFAAIFVASRTGFPAPTIRFWHRFPRLDSNYFTNFALSGDSCRNGFD